MLYSQRSCCRVGVYGCVRVVRPLKTRMRPIFIIITEDVDMAWVILGIAGGFEVFWAYFMKLSDGFTKPLYSAITIAGLIASFLLLAKATKTLPLGTAYAVWTGIGALGSLIVGIVAFKEPVTAGRLFFAALLLAGIVGLKLTSV